MTTTRRLAAILAADVAGYSRLMATDEVGTLTPLKAARRAGVTSGNVHSTGLSESSPQPFFERLWGRQLWEKPVPVFPSML